MSAETPAASDLITLEWDQVLPAVLASLGIKEGLWSVGVGFNLAALNAGPERDQILPSALVSVRTITLRRVPVSGPMVFDAKTGKRVEFSDGLTPISRKVPALAAAPKRKAPSTAKKTKARR